MEKFFIERDKKFNSSGILFFMPPQISKEISQKINDIYRQIRLTPKPVKGYTDFFTIFSQNLSQDIKDWKKNIDSQDVRDLDNFNMMTLKGQMLQECISNEYKNFYLFDMLLRNINGSKVNLESMNSSIKWESIIGIESAKQDKKDKVQNYYNSFYGECDPTLGDKNIRDTAIRETREKGFIKVDKNIFNINYQTRIRQKYGLDNLPTSLEFLENRQLSFFTRQYILLMDEIEYSIETDEKGQYIYVKSIEKPDESVYITVDEKKFTKVGGLFFIPQKYCEVLAKTLDSAICYKLNSCIVDLEMKKTSAENYNFSSGAIISSSILKNEADWVQKITPEQLYRLNKYSNLNLSPENIDSIDRPWSRNEDLGKVMMSIQAIDGYKILSEWDNLLTIEPVRQKTFEKTDRSRFGYFIGDITNQDRLLMDTIKRKSLEEGAISFHEQIYSDEYQRKVRSDNSKIRGIPPYFDFRNEGGSLTETTYTRIYLFFLDKFNVNPRTDKSKSEHLFFTVIPYFSK